LLRNRKREDKSEKKVESITCGDIKYRTIDRAPHRRNNETYIIPKKTKADRTNKEVNKAQWPSQTDNNLANVGNGDEQ